MFNKNYRKTIIVEGMRCEHCAKKVTDALKSLAKGVKVKIDLNEKKVVITSSCKLDDEVIKNKIVELGYEVIKIDEN